MRIRRPAILLSALLVGLFTLPALAGGPTHVDRKGASRIAPRPMDFTAGLDAVKPAAKARDDGPRKLVGMHLRWVTLPDLVLDAFFDEHPAVQGMSVGAEFAFQRQDTNLLVFELDYTGLNIPSTNWLEPGDDPSQARFIESSGLGIVSVDVTYRRSAWLTSRFGFYGGGGLGVGFVVGEAEETPVLPTCEEPVVSCPHWEQVGTQPSELMPVVPILHLQVGTEIRMVGPASLRLEAGIRNGAYVGGGFNVEL